MLGSPPALTARGPAPTGRRAALPLAALALGGFAIGTAEFATMGLLPDIAAGLGVSVPAAGQAITAYAAGVVVGAPLLTVAAARMERRRLLLALVAVFVAGNLLSALAGTLGWLIAARFLVGLPHGVFFGVGAVVGTAVVGQARRGLAVATMMAGLTVANVVGVPLTTVLGQRAGWSAAFSAVAGLGALTAVAVAAWVPRSVRDPGAAVRREAAALRNARLWVVAGAGAIGFGGMFAVYSYVAPLLTEVTGLAAGSVPLVLALFGVGMTVGTLLGGRLADRSVRRAVLVGFVGTAAVLVVIGAGSTAPVAAVVGLVGLGISSQVLSIGLQAHLMDASPAAPSLGAALCHSALNAGNAAGAILGGAVIAAGLGYTAPAWVGVLLTVAGMVVVAADLRRAAGARAPSVPPPVGHVEPRLGP